MNCPSCGAVIPADARYCPLCAQKIESIDSQFATSPGRKNNFWVVSVALAIVAAVLLLALWYLSGGGGNGPTDDGSKTGTLIVTLVNPYMYPGLACNYTLSVNGNLESTGTVPSGGSDVYQKNFSWVGAQLELHVQIEVQGSGTQPEDKMVTLTPGGTERITFVLSST